MLTCKKTYADIPFAHRQHCHDGRCALVHGHNWTFHITFACRELNADGFVVDFGKLKYLKAWIDEHLDHATLLNHDDPLREQLVAPCPEVYKLYLIESCSCEGIAEHLYQVFNAMVREDTRGRAWVTTVTVEEDSKNSATYTQQP
ncbi:MAG: 6-carboxytetrahydropterin synthase [Verrucomicrobiota bacterium]